MRESIIEWIKGFYTTTVNGRSVFDATSFNDHVIWWTLGLFAALILSSALIWFVSRTILIQILHLIVGKTKSTWDDHLMHNKFFKGLAMVVPLMFMEYFLSIVLFNYPNVSKNSSRLVEVLIVLVAIIVVNRFLNGVRDIIKSVKQYNDKPIESYTQVLKIIVTGILVIVILSIITNRSPIFFLTSLGAVSAVLLLVFKDTILGFVGSIQLAANDMIRVGDWITVSKFGADGDVEEINLTTVKVRNFDMTITTVPTYSLVSDSFINWRGMQESEGRRIKRAVKIQLDSVKFASPELLQRLRSFKLLTDFIDKRQKEIEEDNISKGFEPNDNINGRKQTNLGLFRRYIEYYLKRNPEINSELTLIVRQLPSDQYGVPIELYCFAKNQNWAPYEEVIADIFDHIYAIIPQFELRVFESPSGNDFRKLSN